MLRSVANDWLGFRAEEVHHMLAGRTLRQHSWQKYQEETTHHCHIRVNLPQHSRKHRLHLHPLEHVSQVFSLFVSDKQGCAVISRAVLSVLKKSLNLSYLSLSYILSSSSSFLNGMFLATVTPLFFCFLTLDSCMNILQTQTLIFLMFDFLQTVDLHFWLCSSMSAKLRQCWSFMLAYSSGSQPF